MTNYKFTSGPFKGRVTAEGATILDVPYKSLNGLMKAKVLSHWALTEPLEDLTSAGLESAVRSFENSWDSEETEDPIDLWPYSESLGVSANG